MLIEVVITIPCFFSFQIFVFENNIYYRATLESRTIRLVSTGKDGVINGLADWLYEGKTSNATVPTQTIVLLQYHPIPPPL